MRSTLTQWKWMSVKDYAIPWRIKLWSDGKFPMLAGRALSLFPWTFNTWKIRITTQSTIVRYTVIMCNLYVRCPSVCPSIHLSVCPSICPSGWSVGQSVGGWLIYFVICSFVHSLTVLLVSSYFRQTKFCLFTQSVKVKQFYAPVMISVHQCQLEELWDDCHEDLKPVGRQKQNELNKIQKSVANQ